MKKERRNKSILAKIARKLKWIVERGKRNRQHPDHTPPNKWLLGLMTCNPLQQSKAADLKTQSSNGRVKINHREKSETKKSTCYNFSCIFLYAAATFFLESLVRLQKEKVSPTVKFSIVPAINSGPYLHTCHFNKQTHAQGALPLWPQTRTEQQRWRNARLHPLLSSKCYRKTTIE